MKAMADDKPVAKYHPENEIHDFVRRNYTGLENAKAEDIAIGVAGGVYLVAVRDAFMSRTT